MQYLINPLVIQFLDINDKPKALLVDPLGNFIHLKSSKREPKTYIIDEGDTPVYIVQDEDYFFPVESIALHTNQYYKVCWIHDKHKNYQPFSYQSCQTPIKIAVKVDELDNLFHNELPLETERFKLLIEEQIHISKGGYPFHDSVKTFALDILNTESFRCYDDINDLVNLRLALDRVKDVLNNHITQTKKFEL